MAAAPLPWPPQSYGKGLLAIGKIACNRKIQPYLQHLRIPQRPLTKECGRSEEIARSRNIKPHLGQMPHLAKVASNASGQRNLV